MQACKSGGGDTRSSGDGGERALQRRRKEEARARRDAVTALRRAKIETRNVHVWAKRTPRGGYVIDPHSPGVAKPPTLETPEEICVCHFRSGQSTDERAQTANRLLAIVLTIATNHDRMNT